MTAVSEADRAVLAALEDGLPLVPRPYREIGRRVGLGEEEVIERLRSMLDRGFIRRLGVIVRHRELGYAANAMVVWDVPDDAAADVAGRFVSFPFVTLCYRRRRRPPRWPYNLFCMIHGRDREIVLAQVARLAEVAGPFDRGHDVLFSRRCYKQCGARYGAPAAREVV